MVRAGGRLPDLRNPYLCNLLMDFLHSKFCGIVQACSCVLSWSFAHLSHVRLPMGPKLCGLVETCSCATSYLFAHLLHIGLPIGQKLVTSAALGPDFPEPMSLKPLDGFILFEVLWNCLDLYLCTIMVICPSLWIFKVKLWKCCISGMGCLIDMEPKRCQSMGCYTHFVTFNLDLNHDLDLGFSRSNFEKVVSQEWDGWLTWNKRDVSG